MYWSVNLYLSCINQRHGRRNSERRHYNLYEKLQFPKRVCIHGYTLHRLKEIFLMVVVFTEIEFWFAWTFFLLFGEQTWPLSVFSWVFRSVFFPFYHLPSQWGWAWANLSVFLQTAPPQPTGTWPPAAWMTFQTSQKKIRWVGLNQKPFTPTKPTAKLLFLIYKNEARLLI